jgi:hypothetical protein
MKRCEAEVGTPTFFNYATGFCCHVVYLAFDPHSSHIHPFIKSVELSAVLVADLVIKFMLLTTTYSLN